MTSLQQAAAQCKKLETTKKGGFESSFASGLDLTEFEHSATTTTLRTSAAAKLLQIKALEAQHAAREEEKEVQLLHLAKTRGQELTVAASANVRPHHVPAPHKSHPSATSIMEHANMSATLVHLHHGDMNGAHHKAKLAKSVKKSMRRKQQSNGTKKSAMKRSRRSKY